MKKKIEDLEKQLKELINIEAKYKTLLEAIPSMAWFTDKYSSFQEVNELFKAHCGKSIEEIRGKKHNDIWGSSLGKECIQNDIQVINKKEKIVSDETIPGRRGYRKFDIYRSPVIDENGEVLGVIGVARDVTVIENKEAKFQTLIENTPFNIWLRDTEGNYVNANSKFAKEHNITVEQLIGRNIRDLYDKDEINKIIESDVKAISRRKTIKITKEITCKNKRKTVEIYKTPVFDIANEVVGVVGVMVDITKMEKTKEKIKNQAYTDSQTGLLNRRALYEYMNYKLKGYTKRVIILDIDDFKYINDTYGHLVGDKVIQKISNKLKEICQSDFIFRFGGDEFIIVASDDIDQKNIEKKAQNILVEVSNIKHYNMKAEKINISMGIAYCECDGVSCEKGSCTAISKADIALYEAKNNGKNKYVVYTKGLEYERMLERDIERKLQCAIKNDEIELYYQPQYTKENKLYGFEALLRWKNEKYSNIPIIDIIKIMENSNLIIEIGKEIIKKSCLFAKKINEDRDKKIIVSFNVSSVQIMNDEFIKDIKEIISQTKVDPHCIGIEITETVVIDNLEYNLEKIKLLKELGIKISLDDFGTGYSSLNYLVKLPLSIVKIDRSFIVGMDNSKEYTKLVKLIIDASHALNLEVLAEGVEEKKQQAIMTEMGIDYIQGYVFSKPVEEKEALKLI